MLVLSKIIGLLALTVASIFGFADFMSDSSNHNQVESFNECNCIKPLYMRFQGYDKSDVIEFYDTLSHKNNDFLKYEKKYQTLDLFFPLVYGFGLAFCIYMLIRWLCKLKLLPWLLAPVVITMLADWLENSIMLEQLDWYIEGKMSSISEQAIGLASCATQVKIACLLLSSCICIYLAIAAIEKR